MSLETLTVKQAEIEEQVIEKIIAPYLKYAVDTGKILLNDKLRRLPAVRRVAHYLIAKLGWKYLGKNELANGASNQELEEELGIKGNTVRTIVKKLRDAGYISTDKNARHHATAQLAYKLSQQETLNE